MTCLELHFVRVQQLAYIAYVCMPTFIGVCMILDICTLTRMLIFSLLFFQNFQSFSKFSKFFLFIVGKWVPAPPFKAPISWPSLLPLLKIFVAPPLFPVPSRFKVFSTVPRTFTQILSALIWPPNCSWFKQISKGQIYQFNCCFLSKINFNLLNPFTNNLNLWDIFRCIFRQLKKTFFHKIMVAEKNNFSSNNSTILQRVK